MFNSNESKMDISNDPYSFLNKFSFQNNNEEIPMFLKNSVWDEYIGKEMGEHQCLLCHTNVILQRDFQCAYGIPLSKGGSRALNNMLPVCDNCNIKKGDKTIDAYLKTINKQRLLILPEKLKKIAENCILDPEIIKQRSINMFYFNLSDEQICRIIAVNPMLWNQFVYLKDKNENEKIKILLNEKMIILIL